MNKGSCLTDAQRAEFWIRACLGGDSHSDWLACCLRAAYGDMARRTLRMKEWASEKWDEDGFDVWHRTTCEDVQRVYRSAGFVLPASAG